MLITVVYIYIYLSIYLSIYLYLYLYPYLYLYLYTLIVLLCFVGKKNRQLGMPNCSQPSWNMRNCWALFGLHMGSLTRGSRSSLWFHMLFPKKGYPKLPCHFPMKCWFWCIHVYSPFLDMSMVWNSAKAVAAWHSPPASESLFHSHLPLSHSILCSVPYPYRSHTEWNHLGLSKWGICLIILRAK